jgi:hypothetical protein
VGHHHGGHGADVISESRADDQQRSNFCPLTPNSCRSYCIAKILSLVQGASQSSLRNRIKPSNICFCIRQRIRCALERSHGVGPNREPPSAIFWIPAILFEAVSAIGSSEDIHALRLSVQIERMEDDVLACHSKVSQFRGHNVDDNKHHSELEAGHATGSNRVFAATSAEQRGLSIADERTSSALHGAQEMSAQVHACRCDKHRCRNQHSLHALVVAEVGAVVFSSPTMSGRAFRAQLQNRNSGTGAETSNSLRDPSWWNPPERLKA